MTFLRKQSKGFIALMSTLVISSILIVLMFTVSQSTFYARADAMNGQDKRASLGLAEACTNAALLKISQDYNYATTTDPNFGTLSYNAAQKGVRVPVDTGDCYITNLVYTNPVLNGAGQEIKKSVTITTQAKFQNSFSNVTTHATISNPSAGVVLPVPTCNLQASPSPVQSGKPVTVQWSASSNATSFALTPTPSPSINNPSEAQSGTRTYTAGGVGVFTYTGTVSSAGGSAQCTATVTVTSPPPAPACADVVVMLDRTKTMRDDTNAFKAERDAAKAFLDQYVTASLNPLPYVGVGSFRGTDGTNALVPASGKLMNINNYNTLYTTIDSIYSSNADDTGTDLGAAITRAQSELTTGGKPTSKKVIVFMSDGDLTGAEPNGNNSMTDWLNAADAAKIANTNIFTIAYSADSAGMTRLAQLASGVTPYPPNSTGFFSPTSNQHFVGDTGNPWTNSNNAMANGGGAATSINHSNSQQRYYNFNLPALPNGSVINDVQIKADAWVPDVQTSTGFKDPSAQSADTGGDNNGFELNPTNAFADQGGFASNMAGAGDRHRFNGYNFGIPPNAIIKGIEVRLDWWLDSTSGTNSMGVELSWDGGSTWTTTGKADTNESTSNSHTATLGSVSDLWGSHVWIPADFDPATFRVRLTSNSTSGSRNFFLDWVPVRVTYALPTNGCQIGFDLSWDGGVHWSAPEQTWNLPSIETTQTFTNTTGSGWGPHTWVFSDFTNTNFRVRVHSIDPGPTCDDTAVANVDWIQASVLYGSTHQPGSANDQGGNAALEKTDGDSFFIAPTPADMADVFKTIGTKVCPALAPACSNTVDDDADGLIDTADPQCHTDANASNAASYDGTINNEWVAPPIPPPPPIPPAPPPIDIGSWQEQPIQVSN